MLQIRAASFTSFDAQAAVLGNKQYAAAKQHCKASRKSAERRKWFGPIEEMLCVQTYLGKSDGRSFSFC